MNLELAVRLLSGVLLVAANAFFVAIEFALTRLRAVELTDADLEASPGLRRAWDMTERLEIHLTGCQLGISTSSVILGVVAEPAVTQLIRPLVAAVGLEDAVRGISVVLAVIVLNLVHKIWGEQAPTYLGVERPREVAERLAPLLYWWSRIMKPIIYMGDGLAKATLRLFGVEITRSWTGAEGGEAEEGGEEPVTGRADLKRRMADLLARGRIPDDRQAEVMQALSIDDIPAGDVMVPVEDVTWLALDLPDDENLRRMASGGYARYPVLAREAAAPRPRVEDVVGILYLPALFDPPARLRGESLDLADVLEEPPVLSRGLPVSRLIDVLQWKSQEMALLVEDDEAGRVVGVVTISDAFETIAGDVEDPLDEAVPAEDG